MNRERTVREIFGALFQAAPQQQGRAESARLLARFAVLGAFVLGVVPGAAEAVAQTRKANGATSAGVKKTAKSEKPKADDAAGGAEADASKAGPGKVNVRPIKAFLARSKRLHEQGKLDLSKAHSVVVDGDRQADGTLTNVKISGDSAQDPTMVALARDFVSSLNDSRALAFLTDVSHVSMTFILEGERFKALTASDAPSEARAEEMARGYRMLVNVGRLAKRGTDEGALLNGMKVSANGKQLLMNLDMPREQIGNILLRQITPN